jgi:hypothetical protein
MGRSEPDGVRFLKKLALAICKDCDAEHDWDVADKSGPAYRLTITREADKRRLEFVFNGEEITDVYSDDFASLAVRVIERCLQQFPKNKKTRSLRPTS